MSFSNHVKAVKFRDRAKEVMHNHKFVHLREDGVDKNLMDMKSASSEEVLYNICWCGEDCPNYVSLWFITGKDPEAHTIVTSPAGFAWGPTTYRSLELLLTDFEKTSRVWARVGRWSDKRGKLGV